MANLVEDEGWEEIIDELLEEGDEEEEEQPPPGYRVADGPYKAFCSCQDNITCSFCSWFRLIRDCQVHGKATKSPPKPCRCNKASTELLAVSTASPIYTASRDSAQGGHEVDPSRAKRPTRSEVTSASKSRSVCKWRFSGSSQLRRNCPESWVSPDSPLFDTCECRKPSSTADCNCLDGVGSSSSDSTWKDDRPSGFDVSFNDVRSEDQLVDVGGPVGEDGPTENFKTLENGYSILRSASPGKQPTIQDNRPRPCTCDEEPEPRSGSSTELESSVFESSDTDSSSQYDLDLFENLEGNSSSDLTSSENSSVDGADIDWTRVRWIHNASDRSVESVSDDDFDERQRRRAAAKKLRVRPRRRPHPWQKKTAERTSRYQYLVVQRGREKNFLDICRDKKDQTDAYSYHLMSII